MSTTMPTIAERHNLQRGDICEIWIQGGMREPRKHFGKYLFTRGDGTLHFDKGELQIALTFKPEAIRSVRKVTAAYVASQFYVGQWVTIRKYGGDYRASVHEIKRTRLVVVFRTIGGKTKTQSVPAWQVSF